MLALAMLFVTSLFAQDWVKLMQDPTANFYDVQRAFNKYHADYKANYRAANGADPAKVPGEKIYKRWEWFMQSRVDANGNRPAPDAVWNAMEQYYKDYPKSQAAGNWTSLGPNTPSGIPGIGRLNAIRPHPNYPSTPTLYACAPSGGLWISTNDGGSWSTPTDNLPQVIGCSDVAFDPSNPSIMYMSTGDIDGGDNYTVGVLKSTNGGQNWSPTGLSINPAQYRQMGRILVDPSNGQNVICVTTGGIYRSTNGGTSFTMVQAGSFKDAEYKFGNSSIVYAVGTELYKSTNGGATWTKITTGLPAAANLQRMAIAVPASNSAVVYIIAMKAATYDTEGFYKSTNDGANWTKVSTPNIGTQGFYDLAINVSPANDQEVMLGGQTQFYKSTNGGTSWSQIAQTTHVDYHDVVYTSGTNVFLVSDGGIWKSTNAGSTWTNLSPGLVISQLYGFGHSQTNANLIIGGWQDNGTNSWNGSSWSAEMGGDGMLAFVSHSNDNNMWGSQYNGSLNKTTNGGGSWSACGTISETCPWVTPWKEDPATANNLWAGCANVWKSTNGGTSWTKPSNVAGTSTVQITAIGVSKANNQVAYTAKGGVVYKTTNGGTTWTQVTTLPGGTVTDILCHPTDANKAWVTFGGFSNNLKVYQTTNQGTSWTNISGSIPNIPVNCITIDKNGNDALYIGTDNGCFFKDASMTVWQPFSTGLPNVVVSQLEIFYPTSKVRASTYGRGVWESGLYQPGAYAPTANFGADKVIGCPGLGVQFTDYTAGQPTSWSWTFQGGNPATSTQQNPFVAYNTPGTFSVSLTATNANGTDTKTMTNLITISSASAAPTAAGKSFCAPGTVTFNATPATPGTVRWWNAPAGGNVVGTGATWTTPNLTGTTTFYVDKSFPAAGQDIVGEIDNSIGAGAMFSANDIRGLYFDVVNNPVIINSVKVYSQSAGMRTIEIVDSNGNLVTDTTLNVPASPNALTTVNINRTVYPGTNFMMKFRGLVDCYRNSAGGAFPYTSSSVNITGSNAGLPGYYYFFYDWTYTNVVCNTGRTAVTATDTCTVIGINDLFVDGQLGVFPNPNDGQFTVSFNVEKADDFNVQVTNALGESVYSEKLTSFSGAYERKLDLTHLSKGVYMLTISNSDNKAVKRVVVY